jgi:DNA-binding response OmpR family regulator
VEPVAFADRRIAFGPPIGALTVDYTRHHVAPRDFQVGYFLAQNLDNPVNYGTLIEEIWGWHQERPDASLVHAIAHNVSKLRMKMGEELGDPDYGAIRTIEGIGYIAVSEL